MGFSRQEYWSGLLCPSPGDLPDPGIEPSSLAFQADSLPSELPGKPKKPECPVLIYHIQMKGQRSLLYFWNSSLSGLGSRSCRYRGEGYDLRQLHGRQPCYLMVGHLLPAGFVHLKAGRDPCSSFLMGSLSISRGHSDSILATANVRGGGGGACSDQCPRRWCVLYLLNMDQDWWPSSYLWWSDPGLLVGSCEDPIDWSQLVNPP